MSKYYDITKDYLISQCNIIKNSDFKIINKESNINTAVIVEPRKHELLESIIYNVMFLLKKDWNLHIFCGLNNAEFVSKLFEKHKIYITILQIDNLTPESYSLLFQNTSFWESILTNNILIFQTDSYICSKDINISEFINYPYIGGVYKNGIFNNQKEDYNLKKSIHECVSNVNFNTYLNYDININDSPNLNYSINGGFSFRKKDIMIECIKKIKLIDIINYREKHNMNNDYYNYYYNNNVCIGEDTYFQHACELLNYKLPSFQECTKFCTNTLLDNPTESFAIHNINKYNSDKQLYYLEPGLFYFSKNITTNIITNISTKQKYYNLLKDNNFDIKTKLNYYHKLVEIKYGSKYDEDVEQYLCMKYIDKNDIILELGGNIGRVSILLSILINNENNLVVLESNEQHYNEFLENYNMNNCKFNVLNRALSIQPLYQYGWQSFTLEEYNNIIEEQRHLIKQIKTITYKEILSKYNLTFNTLVIDCEGAFYNIIKEEPNILNTINKIIIENDYNCENKYLYLKQLYEKNNFKLVENIKLDKKHYTTHKNQIIRDNFYQVWIKEVK